MKSPNRFPLRPIRVLTIITGLLFVGLTACDSLDALRTQELELPLGDAGTLSMQEGNSFETDEIDGLPAVPDSAFLVQSVAIDSSSLSYSSGDDVESGTAQLFLAVDEVPIVGLTLTVDSSQVTDIAPNPVAIGAGVSDFEDCRASVEGDVPVVPREEYAAVDKEQHLKEAVRSTFSATTVACVDGLNGQLKIDELALVIEVEEQSSSSS